MEENVRTALGVEKKFKSSKRNTTHAQAPLGSLNYKEGGVVTPKDRDYSLVRLGDSADGREKNQR